jgi:hypothetical protein
MESKNNETIQLLDITNENEIALVEKAVFRAFVRYLDKSSEKIASVDKKNKRIAPLVPYSNQWVYVLKKGDVVLAGLSVNHNMKELLQLEMLGFSIDKESACEVLGMFNLIDNDIMFSAMRKLGTYVLNDLRLRNIRKVYGTCLKRRVVPYTIMGFEVLELQNDNGQERALLQFTL